jgi:hypothetical protein
LQLRLGLQGQLSAVSPPKLPFRFRPACVTNAAPGLRSEGASALTSVPNVPLVPK